MNFKKDTVCGYRDNIYISQITKNKSINLAKMNTPINQISIIPNREENNFNIHDSYLEIEFLCQIMLVLFLGTMPILG